MLALYGIALIALGLYGYIHAGSAVSAGMGSLFGLIALLCYWQRGRKASYWIVLTAIALLMVAMGIRTWKTGGAPAPLLTLLLSAAMGGSLLKRRRI